MTYCDELNFIFRKKKLHKQYLFLTFANFRKAGKSAAWTPKSRKCFSLRGRVQSTDRVQGQNPLTLWPGALRSTLLEASPTEPHYKLALLHSPWASHLYLGASNSMAPNCAQRCAILCTYDQETLARMRKGLMLRIKNVQLKKENKKSKKKTKNRGESRSLESPIRFCTK